MQRHFRMHNMSSIDRVIGRGWPHWRLLGQTVLLASVHYGRYTWAAGSFFFFGWTPKATAKVSADVETGTFITEFTANLK